MIKKVLLILLFFSPKTIYSQNYSFNSDTLDLKTNEKVLKHKQLIISCMDNILSQKPKQISTSAKNCFDLQLKLNYNPTYGYNLNANPEKLIKGGNMAYKVIYFAGLTKLRLEYPELLENDTLLTLKSIELFVDYYTKPENNVNFSKEREYVSKLLEDNKLSLYVNNLFISSNSTHLINKPIIENSQIELLKRYKEKLNKLPDSLNYELYHHKYSNGSLKMLAIGKKVEIENKIAIAYLDSALFFHKNSTIKIISYTDSYGRPTGWKKFDKQGNLTEEANFLRYNVNQEAPEFTIKYYKNQLITNEGVYIYYNSKKRKLIGDYKKYSN